MWDLKIQLPGKHIDHSILISPSNWRKSILNLTHKICQFNSLSNQQPDVIHMSIKEEEDREDGYSVLLKISHSDPICLCERVLSLRPRVSQKFARNRQFQQSGHKNAGAQTPSGIRSTFIRFHIVHAADGEQNYNFK